MASRRDMPKNERTSKNLLAKLFRNFSQKMIHKKICETITCKYRKKNKKQKKNCKNNKCNKNARLIKREGQKGPREGRKFR